jgi:alpha-tubulin suppressor-like RCC1 family protein
MPVTDEESGATRSQNDDPLWSNDVERTERSVCRPGYGHPLRRQEETESMTRRVGTSAITCSVLAAFALVTLSGGSASALSESSATSHSVVDTFGVVGSNGKAIKIDHVKPSAIPGITGRVVQIATSNSDTYALTSTGTVWAWGIGGADQLGNGSKPHYVLKAVKVDFPSGVRIASLPNPMPFDAGLAIDSHGNAWGWGINAAHDLCLPGGVRVLRPTKIPLPDVTVASGAGTHSLFDSRGTVYACGTNASGQLGIGTTASSTTPVAVVGLPKVTVKALASSWESSGALLSNGSYYDWGLNSSGQLGDAATTNSSVPVHVNLPAAVVQVFQGGSSKRNGQTLAILANGSLWSWGNDTWGQLGNRSTVNTSIPVRVILPKGAKATRVATSGFASYAIAASGQLFVWGSNKLGQLGTGRRGSDELIPVAAGISLTAISATATNVAGLTK